MECPGGAGTPRGRHRVKVDSPRCEAKASYASGAAMEGDTMPAPLERTRHPGIFKRGSRYVVVYRVDGAERWESARTLDAARRLTAKLADRDRGEFQEQSRLKFRTYAEEWVERYQGNGLRGF